MSILPLDELVHVMEEANDFLRCGTGSSLNIFPSGRGGGSSSFVHFTRAAAWSAGSPREAMSLVSIGFFFAAMIPFSVA